MAATDADGQPDRAGMTDEVEPAGGRRKDTEQRREEKQRHRRHAPDDQQDDLAMLVVADLDIFLVLVGGVVDGVVTVGFEEK